MSQNPVNLNRAIDALRSEQPDRSLRGRVIQALGTPPRRRSQGRWVVASAVAAGVVAILWPRAGGDSAWAQTVDKTTSAKVWHRVFYGNNRNKINGEEWRDGYRSACYGLTPKGGVAWEWRFDGKRRYNYFTLGGVGSSDAPNAHNDAIVVNARPSGVGRYGSNEDFIERLLRQKGSAPAPERVTTSFGTRDRYTFTPETAKGLGMRKGDVLYADADPTSGRILEMRTKGLGLVETVSYPASIPGDVFEPRPQKAKGVHVLDLDDVGRKARESVTNGIASKSGITLRLVILDTSGSLWVLWTGSLPDGKLSRPFQTPGITVGPAFGMREFTTSRNSQKVRPFNSAVTHLGMGGMARTPKVKIGDRIDLSIPANKGFVTFHEVPVLKASQLPHVLNSAFGMP